jgi:hypothetical protein
LLPRSANADALPLLVARGLRAFADGHMALLLPAYLLSIGLGTLEVGVVSTATMLESALATFALGAWGHRSVGRRLLRGAALLMLATGAGFASLASFWPLLIVAFVGTLNPSSGDVSVFLPLERARLAAAAQCAARTALFARYSVIGALCASLGALAVAVPDWLTRAAGVERLDALRGMFLVSAAIGLLVFWLYRRLPSGAIGSDEPPATAALGPSRGIVVRLAALFSVDAFAGGLVVNALLSLWLLERFGLSLAQAGAFFFWAGLLSAASQRRWSLGASAHRLAEHDDVHAHPGQCVPGACRARDQLALGACSAAHAQRTVADGRAHAHRLRDGRGDAAGARGCRQFCSAAQPGGSAQSDVERRSPRRRLVLASVGWLWCPKDRHDLALWRSMRMNRIEEQ